MGIKCGIWSADAIKVQKSFRSLAYQSTVKLALNPSVVVPLARQAANSYPIPAVVVTSYLGCCADVVILKIMGECSCAVGEAVAKTPGSDIYPIGWMDYPSGLELCVLTGRR